MVWRRRCAAAAGVAAFVLVCAVAVVLVAQSRRMRHYEHEYERMAKSTPKAEVLARLGRPMMTDCPPAVFWGDVELSKPEEERIVDSIAYHVRTGFLPVVYRFSFDADGRLVGKHRYD